MRDPPANGGMSTGMLRELTDERERNRHRRETEGAKSGERYESPYARAIAKRTTFHA